MLSLDDKEIAVLGYKLRIPGAVPRIKWACKATVERYNWENSNKSNMIELSVCKAEMRTIVHTESNTVQEVEGSSVCCLVGDGKWKSYAEDGITVEVLSVALSFDELSYTEKELDLEDAADENCILLPSMCLDAETDRFENLLYRIVEIHRENSAITNLACGAAALTLMMELDGAVRKRIRVKRDKYIHYYVDKAEAILNKRYSERITVKGVAAELGITPNYLCAIFKSSKGIGFGDRLLEIRMRRAEALIAEGELSDAQIAASIGYEEIGHFRKRFKKYFGVGIRDFRCIGKELTLYHEKPQRSENEEP